VALSMRRPLMPPLPRARFVLTPRQEQIMDLVVDEGLGRYAIAARLRISSETAKNYLCVYGHKMGIYGRMGCGNITEAAVAYLGYRSLKARGILNGRTRNKGGTGR